MTLVLVFDLRQRCGATNVLETLIAIKSHIQCTSIQHVINFYIFELSNREAHTVLRRLFNRLMYNFYFSVET